MITFAYNTSVHDTTKQTPFAMLYGRQAQLPLDTVLFQPGGESMSTQDYHTLTMERIAELQRAGHLNIQRAQQRAEGRHPALNYIVKPIGGRTLRTVHINRMKKYTDELPLTLQQSPNADNATDMKTDTTDTQGGGRKAARAEEHTCRAQNCCRSTNTNIAGIGEKATGVWSSKKQ